MKTQIDAYIASHTNSWAPTTLRTERARLNSIADRLPPTTSPKELYDELTRQGRRPYSIKTLFIRISDFEQWVGSSNEFKRFINENARLFKHVYEKERVTVSYLEAKKRIETLTDERVRLLALDMLRSGMRSTEALTRSGDTVVGKGGKRRKVFVGDASVAPAGVNYQQLRRALATVGLKPHTLRKLAATELAKRGMQAHDLCYIFGWNNINTAQCYLQPMEDAKIANVIGGAFNG